MRFLGLTLLLFFFLSHPSLAQTRCLGTENQRIQRNIDDLFGYEVRVSGESMAILSLVPGRVAISMYRHDGNRWVFEQELAPQPGSYPYYLLDDDHLALSGNVLALKLATDSVFPDGIHIHVYRHDGTRWVGEQVIEQSNSSWGGRLVLDGDVLAFGSSSRGVKIHRFDGSRWNEEYTIPRSQGGQGLALSKDVLIVGKVQGLTNKVFFFRYDGITWALEQTLEKSFTQPYSDQFGRVVAIDGDLAVIGAPWDFLMAGSAFVYRHDGTQWSEIGQLFPNFLTAGENFGHALAIKENLIVVGSHGLNSPTQKKFGRVFTYRVRSNSFLAALNEIPLSDPEYTNGFGSVVAAGILPGGDSYVALGAPGHTGGLLPPYRGVVTTYSQPELDLQFNPTTATLGTFMRAEGCGFEGNGQLMALAVTSFDGQPLHHFLHMGYLSSAVGQWSWSGTVTANPMVPVGFTAFTLGSDGRIVSSPEAVVTFQ